MLSYWPSFIQPAFSEQKRRITLTHSSCTRATCIGGKCSRALDSLEGDIGIIGAHEPIKSPLTSGTERSRQSVTLSPSRNTTVASAPTICRGIELLATPVEETNASSRDSDIKVIFSKITTCVGNLYNHLLSCDRPRSEGQLITGAAPVTFSDTIDTSSSITIRKAAVNSPRALVGAHKGVTAVTTRKRVGVTQDLSLSVAGVYGPRNRSLTRPRARWLAAIPVSSSLSGSARTAHRSLCWLGLRWCCSRSNGANRTSRASGGSPASGPRNALTIILVACVANVSGHT